MITAKHNRQKNPNHSTSTVLLPQIYKMLSIRLCLFLTDISCATDSNTILQAVQCLTQGLLCNCKVV